MKDAVLITHICIALGSIVAAVASVGLSGRVQGVAHRLFWPLSAGVVLSGIGIMFFGGGVVHACISGVLTLSILGALRNYSTSFPQLKSTTDKQQ